MLIKEASAVVAMQFVSKPKMSQDARFILLVDERGWV